MDCTLRDGGYINNWDFGFETITEILEMFSDTSIEFVEVGFLTNQFHTREQSLFDNIAEVMNILPKHRKKPKYVLMANCGGIDINKLVPCNDESIFGIRIAFHKNQISEALEMGKKVQNLGYRLFFQPICTDFYTDLEIRNLILAINKIKPYAFYIVDSFGTMSGRKVEKLFVLANQYLDKDIMLGFHAHNNLQLAFSNAIKIINLKIQRDIIIDATVYGMGRGAGNLNTELIAQELNATKKIKYDLDVIMDIYEKYIKKLRDKYSWGYSISYFFTAKFKCHPMYAKFMEQKGITSEKKIFEILKEIEEPFKVKFSESYAENLYDVYIRKKCSEDKEESCYADEK